MTTKVTGDMGESVSVRFLKRQGFSIIARNYRKKWGELDIVALKDGALHIFEVKSTKVSREIPFRDIHRLEDNVHEQKLRRIRRTIQTFLAETHRRADSDFYFHVLAVRMDLHQRKASIYWIKNVVL
jgi:putative endonuclease